jgi:DNA-binding NarL/FixJ family response regulator
LTPDKAPKQAGTIQRRSSVGDPQRLLVVAEEPLQARALACLLEQAAGFTATPTDSLARLPRLLDAGAAAIVWLTDTADRARLDELAEIRRARGGIGLCILARRVDPMAFSDLLSTAPRSTAVLLRENRPDAGDLVSSIRHVVRGRVVLGERMMEELLTAKPARHGALEELSGQERRVLELLAMGLRNREIARRLSRSEKLVEKHVQRVFAKLGLDHRPRGPIDRRVTAARMYLMRDDERARDPQ